MTAQTSSGTVRASLLINRLLILTRAWYSEPGAPSPGAAAGFAFARIFRRSSEAAGRQAVTTCLLPQIAV